MYVMLKPEFLCPEGTLMHKESSPAEDGLPETANARQNDVWQDKHSDSLCKSVQLDTTYLKFLVYYRNSARRIADMLYGFSAGAEG